MKTHIERFIDRNDFIKVKGIKDLSEIGGNELKERHRGGDFKFVVGDLKRSSESLADENRNFLSEKVKRGKFLTESEKFFGNRGKSETRGEMHHCLRGDGRT